MSADFERLLQTVRARAPALSTLSDDTLAQLTDSQFEACVNEIRAWREGSMAWVEQQALGCASRTRKLALLRIVLDHVTSEDRTYAADATSGGEGAARMQEINEPGYNLEADRVRGLIRRAIMG